MDPSSTPPEPNATRRPLDENIKAKSTWLRLFFMLVFVVLYGIAEFVTAAVVVLQFFWVLFTGERNPQLRGLGQSLATYTYQVFLYLTYNSERRPFPFDAVWPQGPPQAEPEPPPRPGPPPPPPGRPEPPPVPPEPPRTEPGETSRPAPEAPRAEQEAPFDRPEPPAERPPPQPPAASPEAGSDSGGPGAESGPPRSDEPPRT